MTNGKHLGLPMSRLKFVLGPWLYHLQNVFETRFPFYFKNNHFRKNKRKKRERKHQALLNNNMFY